MTGYAILAGLLAILGALGWYRHKATKATARADASDRARVRAETDAATHEAAATSARDGAAAMVAVVAAGSPAAADPVDPDAAMRARVKRAEAEVKRKIEAARAAGRVGR
jgi:hypothetical protein